MFKKIVLGAAGLLFIASAGLEFSATRAYAKKVDCAKVMEEVGAGKKAREIAKDLGIPVLEQVMPRELLYIADEVFFTGTAAEITPIRSVDKISVGKGVTGPITRSVQQEFYGIVRGEKPDRFQWLTPVPVGAKQPVTV